MSTPPTKPANKPRSNSRLRRIFKGAPKDDAGGDKERKNSFTNFNGPPSGIVKNIRSQIKDSNRPIEEVVDALEIGPPTDFEHKLNVRFDEKNIRYSGIPADWASEAHKQFGVPLASCPRMKIDGYEDRIPIILVLLRSRLVEMNGLSADGVFRLAPDGTESNEVKSNLNTGRANVSLGDTLDPNVVANLIKQFYRELKPNLLNCHDRDTIFKWADLDTNEELEIAMDSIPEPSKSAFLWLLDLLADTAEKVDENRMTPKNLAIVLAPNLYDAGADASPMEALVCAQKVATLVSIFLKYRIETRGSIPVTTVDMPSPNEV